MCFAEIFADCVPSKAMLGYQDWRSNIEWGIFWDIAGKMNGDWRRQLWLNRTCFREGNERHSGVDFREKAGAHSYASALIILIYFRRLNVNYTAPLWLFA